MRIGKNSDQCRKIYEKKSLEKRYQHFFNHQKLLFGKFSAQKFLRRKNGSRNFWEKNHQKTS